METPELMEIPELMKYLYTIYPDKPALSSKEKGRLLRRLIEMKKRRDTDSSIKHETPELIKDIYTICLDEPALSSEEQGRLLSCLIVLNKRRSQVMRWKKVGRVRTNLELARHASRRLQVSRH